MKVSMIVAVNNIGVIGGDNTLPWRIPTDLKFFKEVTTGHPVIMGRRTFESIGRPLPKRRNIILTSKNNIELQTATGDILLVSSFDEVIELYKDLDDELFIIGGGQIYNALQSKADKLYLTLVDCDKAGDTLFNLSSDWKLDSESEWIQNEKDEFRIKFKTFIK